MKTLYATTFLIIGLLAAVLPLSAQQVPLVTGFGFQTQLANPAEKGTHNSPITLWYRKQWASFGADSPTTYNLDADLSRLFGEESRVGVGLRLMSDQAHIVKRTNVNLDFAYHLISTESLLLSAGVTAGLLNQRMDFGDTRVNEPADLTLFQAAESKMRFDGGPSIFLRVGSTGGSHLKAGASLPQLFTSDLDYLSGRIFGLQPHLQGYASYMLQTGSVGIEPIVFARTMFGDFDCKCTNIDLLLRAHLLDGGLWVGGGYRVGSGSLTGGLGVSLLDQKIQINALVESLTDFGLSYEGGLTFALGESDTGPTPSTKMPANVQQSLSRNSSESDAIILESRYLQQSVDQNLTSASVKLNEAKGKTSKKQIKEDIMSVRDYLNRAGQDLELLLDKSGRLSQLNTEATQVAETYRQAKNKDVVNIQRDYEALSGPVAQQATRFKSLKEEIDAFVASKGLDVIDILKDDADLVQEYFQQSLDKLAVKPSDTRPVKVSNQGAYVDIEYQFPYNELAYNVSKETKLNDVKSMADHVAGVLTDLSAKGISVHSVTIQGNLQSGMSDLDFESGVKYAGEFGAKPKLEYSFQDSANAKETARTKTLASNKEMNFEELSALQMYALKDNLDQRKLLTKDQVKYKLYGPVSANEYFLETSILIRLKK
ncbi:MAG: PorP/SprF family type IX secretion system membrane protein [Saprospirales bacterium]|nr:PorP/SprF family type IX secretion system membrane protein [Saprospirales bacterium]